jgi:hypothetical protein
MKGYMKMRNHITKDDGFVFVTCKGGKMLQSNIATALSTAFKSSGYSRRVSCTKVRKTAVSVVYQHHPEERQKLAMQMCHLTTTEEQFYLMNNKQLNSVHCSNLLRTSLKSFKNSSCTATSTSDTATPFAVGTAVDDDCANKEQQRSELNEMSIVNQPSEVPRPYTKKIKYSLENRDRVHRRRYLVCLVCFSIPSNFQGMLAL